MEIPAEIIASILAIGGDALSLFGSIITNLWPWLLGFGALFGLVFYIKGRVGSIGR